MSGLQVASVIVLLAVAAALVAAPAPAQAVLARFNRNVPTHHQGGRSPLQTAFSLCACEESIELRTYVRLVYSVVLRTQISLLLQLTMIECLLDSLQLFSYG